MMEEKITSSMVEVYKLFKEYEKEEMDMLNKSNVLKHKSEILDGIWKDINDFEFKQRLVSGKAIKNDMIKYGNPELAWEVYNDLLKERKGE